MGLLKKFVYGSVALLLLFVMASTIWMDYFSTTYEYGFGDEPCNKDGCESGNTAFTNNYCLTNGTTVTSCTSCNATAGYEFFLDNCHSLIAWNNNTDCWNCSEFQGYQTSTTGLLLLVMVIGIIGFAVYFLREGIKF